MNITGNVYVDGTIIIVAVLCATSLLHTLIIYALPAFWPQDRKGILFLDEISKGREEVGAPLLQLLNERRLHNYTLPPDWI